MSASRKPARPRDAAAAGLTHQDSEGRARMVDVGGKEPTARRAVAEARVTISAPLEKAIRGGTLSKGDALEVARIAGILAAKRTWELIPLCHPLPLEFVDVQAHVASGAVLLRSEVKTTARTGVEMEAYTAVAVAALTLVDMGKSLDRSITIDQVRLIEKSGGRSGDVRPHPSQFP